MTEQNGVGRSATEELRRMLDERGVEHYDGTESTLWGYESYNEVTGIYRYSADETSEGYMQVRLWHVTPEQAIEVTLEQEDAYTREDVESAFVRGYSLGSLPVGSDPRWDENVQTVDEHMDELGWVRKATLGVTDATGERHGGAGTCHNEDGWCSECQHFLHDSFKWCPWCGREVVDE